MAQMYYDKDADLGLIQSKKVAVIGFGSQGHAHALNMADSGVEVRVGLRDGSRSAAKARAAGLTVSSIADAAAWADVIMVLAPDTEQARHLPDVHRAAPRRRARRCSSPTASTSTSARSRRPPPSTSRWWRRSRPGHRVREVFVEGAGTPALIAVHQDATGQARALALSYAKAIGVTRAGRHRDDLRGRNGDRPVRRTGRALRRRQRPRQGGFETLVEAGYQPEIAYFECLHELKLIVDLMYRGGLNYMRYSVSDTAEHGDYTGGPRIVTDATREARCATC